MTTSTKLHQTRTVLEFFQRLGQREFTNSVAQELFDAGQFQSVWSAFRAIHNARTDGFLRDASGYGGTFSRLVITECGVARLDELIHHDWTRTACTAANSILAEMGLSA